MAFVMTKPTIFTGFGLRAMESSILWNSCFAAAKRGSSAISFSFAVALRNAIWPKAAMLNLDMSVTIAGINAFRSEVTCQF